MTERLTRAQRRAIENSTHQKIDLDNLDKFEAPKAKTPKAKAPKAKAPKAKAPEAKANNAKIPKTKKIPLVVKEESADESDDENKVENKVEKVEESADESTDESAEESADESADESSEEESDDEDLDALLNKAQEALSVKSDSIQFEDDNFKKMINTKISQMNIGMSVDKELYFKTHSGRAKLIPEAVELLGEGEKASKHATVVLKASKEEDAHKLNKKERQAEREKTTGSAWFDMPKAEMTPEIKRDLQILKMRHILDRKRHYKKMGNRPDPKYFQIGTIIESPTEFYSARLNKKDRKQTIVEELMANDDQKNYYKRKYNEVQERTNSGGKKHFKKLKAQRQWAK